MTISAKEKYMNHPLFAKCIGITVPTGHTQLFDDLVQWLENYNKENKTNIGFVQIKLKFGLLTIYVEHYNNNHNKWQEKQKSLEWPEYYKIRKVQSHIADVCKQSQKLCKVCGKQKTEMVVNSIVKLVCFDHMKNENTWWNAK